MEKHNLYPKTGGNKIVKIMWGFSQLLLFLVILWYIWVRIPRGRIISFLKGIFNYSFESGNIVLFSILASIFLILITVFIGSKMAKSLKTGLMTCFLLLLTVSFFFERVYPLTIWKDYNTTPETTTQVDTVAETKKYVKEIKKEIEPKKIEKFKIDKELGISSNRGKYGIIKRDVNKPELIELYYKLDTYEDSERYNIIKKNFVYPYTKIQYFQFLKEEKL